MPEDTRSPISQINQRSPLTISTLIAYYLKSNSDRPPANMLIWVKLTHYAKVEMDTLVETLNVKLARWQPDVAELARQFILEIIDLADRDALDILRSRSVEQEVLDLLDEC
jgi:hypothetical protein